jgi:hypothetical protein
MKITRLTKEDGAYQLTIHEAGKKPTYIRWELGKSIVKINAPSLPWERMRSLYEQDIERLTLALETKREDMLEEVLFQILKDSLKMWKAWEK